MRTIALACLLLCGCATERAPVHESEVVDTGDPAADIGASFNIGAPRPVREKKAEPNQFFFKECSASESDNYYSKTSYYCN